MRKNQFLCASLLLVGLLHVQYGLSETQNRQNIMSMNETFNENYLMARYVIGSGGVMGAIGMNHFHMATSGQTFIGFSQGSDCILCSGFWVSNTVKGTEVSTDDSHQIPKTFALYQNYPNPFNPETAIEYDVPSECLVTVAIYNVSGQCIRIMTYPNQGPGHVKVIWDSRDSRGNQMGSGVYLYRVSVLEKSTERGKESVIFHQAKKMILVR